MSSAQTGKQVVRKPWSNLCTLLLDRRVPKKEFKVVARPGPATLLVVINADNMCRESTSKVEPHYSP